MNRDNYINIVILAPLVTLVIWMFVYNIMHPELTEMQLLIMFWHWYVAAALLPLIVFAVAWIWDNVKW